MTSRTLIALLIITTPLPLWAGTVAVQVRDGRARPVVDAVVHVVPEGRSVAPARANAVMDQKDRTFIPHVLAIQVGTAVHFPNSDDIQHHVYSFSRPKPFQLPLYKGTPANPVVFDKPGVVILGCNIHDRMSAYIVVVETPYFGKTDARGSVEIGGLPPGTYSIRLWSREMRTEPEPMRVVIESNERHELTFSGGR